MVKQRCSWAEDTEKMKHYHDTIWGVPVYDDQRLFRKLVLNINQAGLSWQTILNKEHHFDAAFDNFDIKKSPITTKDLKKRGFKYVSSTIIYAFLEATGMINDHEMTCFRYEEIQ